jgi:hypothetical protein
MQQNLKQVKNKWYKMKKIYEAKNKMTIVMVHLHEIGFECFDNIFASIVTKMAYFML